MRRRKEPGRRVRAGGLCAFPAANSFAPAGGRHVTGSEPRSASFAPGRTAHAPVRIAMGVIRSTGGCRWLAGAPPPPDARGRTRPVRLRLPFSFRSAGGPTRGNPPRPRRRFSAIPRVHGVRRHAFRPCARTRGRGCRDRPGLIYSRRIRSGARAFGRGAARWTGVLTSPRGRAQPGTRRSRSSSGCPLLTAGAGPVPEGRRRRSR
jgi:hypothetical protein